MRRAPAFGTMVKPIGSACNLDCHYCYYRDKSEIYSGAMPRMSDELLEIYIRQYIEGASQQNVSFCWHGGEPLMAGLPFFRKAMELQQKYADGKRIENTLQTNGILLNEEWCSFSRITTSSLAFRSMAPRIYTMPSAATVVVHPLSPV